MAEVEERPIVGNAGAGAIGLDGAPKMPRAVPKTPEAIWQQQQNAADKYEAAKLAQFKATDTEYEKGLEPLQKERDAAVKAREAVAPYKDPEKLPGEAPKFTKTEMSQMPQVLLALAAFSGLASRQPLTASLNAMAGLITGIHTGDVEMFDKNFKVYDENFKRAEALNKQALKEYDDIMKHHEWSITEKDRRIHDWEVKHQHKVSAEMREHGLSKAQEWRNAADRNLERARADRDRLAERHQHNQEMKTARAGDGSVKPMTANQMFHAENDLPKSFQAEGKPIEKLSQVINKIEVALATDSAVAKDLVKQYKVELSALPRATNYMLKLGMNPGNLPERIVEHLSEFATGKTTAAYDAELRKMLSDMRNNYVDPSLQLIQYNYEGERKRLGLKGDSRRLFSTEGDVAVDASHAPNAKAPATGAPMSLDEYLKAKGH